MAFRTALFVVSVTFTIISNNFKDVLAKPPNKITGGVAAEITEFPAMASIKYAKSHICGGAIISKNKILTAAHCLTNENKKTGQLTITPVELITVGTGNKISKEMQNIYKAKKLDIHAGYTGDMEENACDIAIITLEENIVEDATQKVISLPQRDAEIGANAFVAGWGSEREYGQASPLLKKAPMTVISNAQCRSEINDKIISGHLCAIYKRGVGFCDGDSGGPLMSNGEVIGVVSMSIDCGKGHPDIYTRVYSYIDWIRNRI